MATFLKAQASSLIASAIDFSTTIILKEIFSVWYLAASVTGTIAGGITNFLVNRNWVFEADSEKTLVAGKVTETSDRRKTHQVSVQAARYLLVWAGNVALNAGGVYLITHYGGVSYMISKIFVALLVGFTYNYLLQKRFVFSKG